VEHAKTFIKKKDICFISGKFEHLQQAKPLSSIEAALAEYTNVIVKQGREKILQTRWSIIQAIKSDVGVLTETFPCLSKIIGKLTSTPADVHFIAAQNRFKFIFQMFVRAITTKSAVTSTIWFFRLIRYFNIFKLSIWYFDISEFRKNSHTGGIFAPCERRFWRPKESKNPFLPISKWAILSTEIFSSSIFKVPFVIWELSCVHLGKNSTFLPMGMHYKFWSRT